MPMLKTREHDHSRRPPGFHLCDRKDMMVLAAPNGSFLQLTVGKLKRAAFSPTGNRCFRTTWDERSLLLYIGSERGAAGGRWRSRRRFQSGSLVIRAKRGDVPLEPALNLGWQARATGP